MKKVLLILVLVQLFLMQLVAQNLIQNGGFEIFFGIPGENDNLSTAVDWDYIDSFS